MPSNTLSGNDRLTSRDGTPLFVLRAESAQAYGFPAADGGFVVLKGSTCMREGNPNRKRDLHVRDDLVRSGILVQDTDERLYRFSADHRFSSPSRAAGIVKNGNASGPSLWKDPQSGLSLKDYRDDQRS